MILFGPSCLIISAANDNNINVLPEPVGLVRSKTLFRFGNKPFMFSTASHRIFVRGDAHIDYGRVMQVMGQITEGGFTHVALLAQQPANGRL